MLLLVLPEGLGGGLYRIRDLVLRRIADRRGLVVPSLLADRRTYDTPEDVPVLAPAQAREEPRRPNP